MGMEKVSTTLHMVQRKNVWYYRRRVPEDLIETLETKTIQFSLATTSKKTAIKKREEADVASTAKFDEARAKLKSGGKIAPEADPNAQRPLTRSLALRLLQDYVERTDERRRDVWVADAPESSDERREAEKNIEMDL